MKPQQMSTTFRSLVSILCTILIVPGDILAYTPQQSSSSSSSSAAQTAKIPPEQLDSLVAPIALYPDPLLAQVLAGRLDPSPVLDLTVSLQDIALGYRAMDQRQTIKVMVRP